MSKLVIEKSVYLSSFKLALWQAFAFLIKRPTNVKNVIPNMK
jgi:hypothetical protein